MRALFWAALLLGVIEFHAPAEARGAPDLPGTRSAPAEVSFVAGEGTVELKVSAEIVGTYVYKDPLITRPHFRNLHAPGGALVTRAHPPVEGRDAIDHADMHPGAWLAFGDIGGADTWRNKARVTHVKFVEEPAGGPGRGTFTVLNEYGDGRGGVVCDEVCRFTVLVRPAGYLLISDSIFRARAGQLAFGDQEEMGFGVRVATGITVQSGGRIIDNEGRENEAGVWGKKAAWVDYSGPVGDEAAAAGDERRAGCMLIPDPANPHASRFHVRDYGLMVANPFGRAAFGEKDHGPVVVPAGAEYRLRFGLLLHASPAGAKPELAELYEDCLRAFEEAARP